MKKILMIILLLGAIFAETITLETGANVREEPKIDSEIIAYIAKDKVIEVTDKVASYYRVIITGGSIHKGKDGYMWSGRVFAGEGNVIGKGVVLRSSPEYNDNGTPMDPTDDDNFVAKVRAGATVKIVKTVYSWYKVFEGWINAYCVRENEY